MLKNFTPGNAIAIAPLLVDWNPDPVENRELSSYCFEMRV